MKTILALLGLISLGLGIVGAFLPLLPTVPFVLLSAFLFARSSDRLHNWLMTHKIFGQLIRDYHEERGITIQGKVAAIGMMWISNIISIIFVIKDILWLQILMSIITLSVTIYILQYKTKRKS
ncbi:protein of unknown function DUF454 [Paludibacter propionicigenes WB4]|uniref:DUF454 domain-containing protein n=1 Tax=Paludibacter propionicigenes (strain DSM 17365 / JCM 13257 / WB4) TaxID=694427 RepID=E4T1D3_PALPW|nr:YbaN family protein [Paludibacter propionicigenes]ADQ78527.1 protein of unknown function DUF454 [Paludibacter propionicigenes WB4]